MNTELSAHHYNSNIPVCRTYCEIFGSDAGGNIYKAIQNIWQGLSFYSSFLVKKRREANCKDVSQARTTFFHGVIVLKGILILAEKTEDDINIDEAQHILLRTTDCVTKTDEPFAPYGETIIDVITEQYLEEYLLLCEKDLQLYQSHIERVYNSDYVIKTMNVEH